MAQSVSLRIQNLFREHFPGVSVVPHDPKLEDTYFDVFFLPDDKRREFVRFQIEQYAALAKGRELPLAVFVFHTISETRKNYPHIRNEVSKAAGLPALSRQIRAEKSTHVVAAKRRGRKAPGQRQTPAAKSLIA